MCNKKYGLVHHKRLLLPAIRLCAGRNGPYPHGLLEPPPLQHPVLPRAEQLSAYAPHKNYFFTPNKLFPCLLPAQTTCTSLPLLLCVFIAFLPFFAAYALLLPLHPKGCNGIRVPATWERFCTWQTMCVPQTPPPGCTPSQGLPPPSPSNCTHPHLPGTSSSSLGKSLISQWCTEIHSKQSRSPAALSLLA